MKREPKIFLQHIIESIGIIEKHLAGISMDNFLQNVTVQDAVVRRIEIIGEAIKNLPINFREQYPNVNWRGKAGMRDMVVHEYFGVDLNLVWKTTQELSNFKQEISKILDNLDGQETIKF